MPAIQMFIQIPAGRSFHGLIRTKAIMPMTITKPAPAMPAAMVEAEKSPSFTTSTHTRHVIKDARKIVKTIFTVGSEISGSFANGL